MVLRLFLTEGGFRFCGASQTHPEQLLVLILCMCIAEIVKLSYLSSTLNLTFGPRHGVILTSDIDSESLRTGLILQVIKAQPHAWWIAIAYGHPPILGFFMILLWYWSLENRNDDTVYAESFFFLSFVTGLCLGNLQSSSSRSDLAMGQVCSEISGDLLIHCLHLGVQSVRLYHIYARFFFPGSAV